MGAKGALAKENVIKKLQEAFGEDWIGENNKKYYVWAKGETGREQIAFSLTCPKVEISVVDTGKLDYGANGLDFESMSAAGTVIADPEPAEFTEEEEKNISDLMAALGL